ncbi:hypothetical protein RQP46_009186 [Phenoliferia psychrophenolica]
MGQKVTGLCGVVTAKSASGFYIQSLTPDDDDRTSEGLYIFGGDSVGAVSFQLPAATVDVETDVTSLQLDRGLDFWESLEGMLVTIPAPRAVSRSSRFRDIWIVDESYATTSNAQGGINLVKLGEGQWDSNPEAIHLSYPLDGTRNPTTTVFLGTKFESITGIVSYAYGFPVLYPTTTPTIVSSPSTAYPQSPLRGDGKCQVGVANYNVLNLHPTGTTFGRLAGHIVNIMNSPDVIGLEEIQDNSGATDDGTTSSIWTLGNLTAAITAAGGPRYTAMDIDPIDKNDGGAPGGSLIDPTNSAWSGSRKPLTASFVVKGSTATRKRLHVIVAHLASKFGSGTSMGRNQVAVNGAIEARIAEATVIKDFIAEFTKRDPDAHVVLVGDINDFSGTQPLDILSSVMTELVVPDIAERYSYNYDQNTQQIDHILVLPSLAAGAKVEMVHVNTWGKLSAQASDHDPVLAQINVC